MTSALGQTTGTTSFLPDVNEIIEEAYERCGAELRSGYDFRTAVRSLNLLLMEWANRGINLWTLDANEFIYLTPGQATYTLPLDTVDLLDHVIRTGSGTNQQDINITRISSSTYWMIPNKNATGRPIQVWINRLSGQTSSTPTVVTPLTVTGTGTTATLTLYTTQNAILPLVGSSITVAGMTPSGFNGTYTVTATTPTTVSYANTTTGSVTVLGTVSYTPTSSPTITVWPTPDSSTTYTFAYTRLRRMQDAGTGINAEDVPFRMWPALISGLAYYLSMKIPNANQRTEVLKAMYDEDWQRASDEDREKAAVRFVPREMFIGYR
jgi:hypothetical protein